MFAWEARPPAAVLLPGAALALFPQAVEVGVQQQLLAGQPLGRVHPQTSLDSGNHGNRQKSSSSTVAFVPYIADIIWEWISVILTFMRLRAWTEMVGYFCSRGSWRETREKFNRS